jgi:hypothetical protein
VRNGHQSKSHHQIEKSLKVHRKVLSAFVKSSI